MEIFEITLLLLAAVLLSAVIDQLVPKVSSPLIQIALGLLIATFAVTPIEFDLDPDFMIVLLIAPLLFYEAKKAHKVELWKNKLPVLSLAIGLVVGTMMAIGFYVNWLIPSIPLAAAFALGAALGPTDAVAVAALSKQVKLSKRQSAILEGESLINDASGVVTFQFAIAAVITGAFALGDASHQFVIEFFGGIMVGVVLGFVVNFISNRVRAIGLENTTFHVLLEVFSPFIIYLAAHEIHTSGILAVVAAGLVISLSPKEVRPSISRANIVSNSIWKVFTFALNGLVFVLLGAQFPSAMTTTWENGVIGHGLLVVDVVVVTLMVILSRYLWVLATDLAGLKKRENRKPNKSDLKTALVTTLAGPKGAFTLILMMALPFTIPSAEGATIFPERSLLLFLACGVIIVTLLLATFVVPLLAPKNDEETEEEAENEGEVSIEILRNVINALNEQETSENQTATQGVIRSYNTRILRLKNSNDIEVSSNKELRLTALRWEQNYITSLIEKGDVDPEVASELLEHISDNPTLRRQRSTNPWISPTHELPAITLAKSLIRKIGRALASKKIHHGEEFRKLQIRSVEHVILKLHEENGNPDIPAEDLSALLFDYLLSLRSLKRVRPNAASLDRFEQSAAKATDIRKLGLQLELEQIQSMYEAERISRNTANKLRENVNLMQLDLDQSIS